MAKRITTRQRQFITRYAREYHSDIEWGRMFDMSVDGVYRWKKVFEAEIQAERLIVEAELKAKFDDIRDEAFNVLAEDLHNPDPKVRAKAWQYILDHAGYNATKKIDITDNNFSDTFTPNEIAAIKERILMIDNN